MRLWFVVLGILLVCSACVQVTVYGDEHVDDQAVLPSYRTDKIETLPEVAPSDCPELFSDEFDDDDSSCWQTWVGGWEERGGVYRATNKGANIRTESVWVGGYKLEDYVFEADLKTTLQTISDAGLVFRYVNDDMYCYCGFNKNNHGKSLRLRILVDGKNTEDVFFFDYDDNQPYRLRAIANGDKVSCEVIGYPETRLEIAKSMWLSGTVGFRNAHIAVDYDNAMVEKISWFDKYLPGSQ